MITMTIYIVKNKVNDNVYIGVTKNIKNRWCCHKTNALKRNKPSKFYNAIREIGIENFYYEILEENVDASEGLYKETEYIKKYDSVNNGYNTKYRLEEITKMKSYDIEEIIKLYQEGCSLKEIGEKYKTDKEQISKLLKKAGVEIRNWNKLQSNPIITKEFLEEEIVNKRKKVSTVADEVNLSTTAIRNWLRKIGIKMPLSTVK